MWVNATLLLTMGLGAPSATMQELSKLAGSTWVSSIVLPNKIEHVTTRYRVTGGGLQGKGTACEPGGELVQVRSNFTDSPDGIVKQHDFQGPNELIGTARLRDKTVVFRYGPKGADPEMIQDELTFVDGNTAKGVVKLKSGKVVATYTMHRVHKGEPETVLDGNDPVALVQGQATPGKPELVETIGEWRYLFSSESTRKQFQADSRRYGVQFGGACMNMGPLTGRGAPHLFKVHRGFSYLFASAGCRTAFATDPDNFIDKADTPVAVSKTEQAQALTLLDKVARAHGGRVLGSMKTLYWHQYTLYKDGERQGESWQGRAYEPWPMAVDEQEFMVRKFMRHPIWLLRNRKAEGFAAKALPSGSFREMPNCLVIRTHHRGATSDLFVDPSNHRIVGMRYVGRFTQANSKLDVAFGDWRTVAGVVVPFETTVHNGDKKRTEKNAVVQVNKGVNAETFRNLL